MWFADALLSRSQGRLLEMAGSNRGAFVLSALAGVPSCMEAVRAELGSPEAHAQLSKLASDGKSKGAQVLIDKLAGKGRDSGGQEKKNSESDSEPVSDNVGGGGSRTPAAGRARKKRAAGPKK
ncbi:unnamed protein product [Discosporangium mesarthrocarpum]